MPSAADAPVPSSDVLDAAAHLRGLGFDVPELPPQPGRPLPRKALRALVDLLGTTDDERALLVVVRSLATAKARGVAVPALLRELDRGHAPAVSAEMLRAVAVTATEDDAAAVVQAWSNRDLGPARSELAPALRRLDGPEVTAALAAALDDDDVRVAALGVLRAHPRRAFVGRVRPLTRHQDPAVRAAARQTLSALLDHAHQAMAVPDAPAVARLRTPRPAPEPPAGPTPAADSAIPAGDAGPRPPAASLHVGMEEGLSPWVRQSFRSRSRASASLGTLTLALSLLALWSHDQPNWVLLGVSAGFYALAWVLQRTR